MASALLQKTPYGSFGGQPGGPLAKYQGKALSPSVMDKEELPLTAEELARSLAEKDAIGPPMLGPISIDPTDWLTPGGLAKIGAGFGKLLGAGIIAGARTSARDLGIVPIVNHIEELAKSGVSQHNIAQVSSELLAEQRNPGGAMSMFIGPDGKSRVVLANKDAQLHNPVLETKTINARTGKIRTKIESLFDDLGKRADINLKSEETRLLSDTLLHPSLYNISDKAKATEVVRSDWVDLLNPGGMALTPDAKRLLVGSYTSAASKKGNDQLGHTLEGFLHEGNHIVQLEQGLRTGTSNTIDALRGSIAEAKKLGSFKSNERLQAYETILDRMDLPQYRDANGNLNERASGILKKMYQSNYGEWEARAGSEYSDTTFPMMHERGKTW